MDYITGGVKRIFLRRIFATCILLHMADKKIIAVVGSTGAQGGGLVRAILDDASGEFTPRAVTRDVNSAKAQELARAGAEVVAADVDDADSIQRAFEGAYGAYCVTFFWNHFSTEKELAEAAAMAQAAKRAGLQHVIWSTLEDTRLRVPLGDDRMPMCTGKYKVPHFDAKGEANHFFTDAGLPVTLLLTSFYWDNFIYFGMGPQKGPDGKLAITLPMGDKKLPGIAAEDIGRCAYGVFQNPGAVSSEDGGNRGRASDRRGDGGRLQQSAGYRGRVQRSSVRGVSGIRFSGSGRSGQHVSVQTRFQ